METISLFNEAETLFNSAKEDMMKPEEDLVPYGVCHKCFYAISHYLKGFLHHNNISVAEDMEMSELVTLATETDSKFNDLNRKILIEPKNTEDVWMNTDRAEDFLELTKKTRFLVGL
jgi:hypothetical protein